MKKSLLQLSYGICLTLAVCTSVQPKFRLGGPAVNPDALKKMENSISQSLDASNPAAQNLIPVALPPAAPAANTQVLIATFNELNSALSTQHTQEMAIAQETMNLINALKQHNPKIEYAQLKTALSELTQYKSMLTQPQEMMKKSNEILSGIKKTATQAKELALSIPQAFETAEKLLKNIEHRIAISKTVMIMETQRLMVGIHILFLELERLEIQFKNRYQQPLIQQISIVRGAVEQFHHAQHKREKVNIIMNPVLNSIIAQLEIMQPFLQDISPLIADLSPYLLAPTLSSARITKENLQDASVQEAYKLLANIFDIQKLEERIHLTPQTALSIYTSIDAALATSVSLTPKIAANITQFAQDKIPTINGKLRTAQSLWNVFNDALNTLYAVIDPARKIISTASKVPGIGNLLSSLKNQLNAVTD